MREVRVEHVEIPLIPILKFGFKDAHAVAGISQIARLWNVVKSCDTSWSYCLVARDTMISKRLDIVQVFELASLKEY